ncbi:hypothetical protein QCA50_015396 [Cerrena zonata]|uniref:Uncharacterized protein n=1 Tax=Cerrena zonata TaxID=2478898 RepID=A0AAW0FQV5_9APHY
MGSSLTSIQWSGSIDFSGALRKSKQENEYRVKIYEKNSTGLIFRKPDRPNDPPMIFENKTRTILSLRTRKKRRTHDIPDSRFLAIHAALAGILHMSGIVSARSAISL